jgi:Tfp pilus assembly protein PilX
MKQQFGFILIITLLTMVVLSLLTLNTMHYLLLYQKAITMNDMNHKNLYLMEHTAMQLAQTPSSELNTACITKEDNIAQATHPPKQCKISVGRNEFNYILEDLGDTPCFIIQKDSNKWSTHHRRVSILLTNTESAGALLQIRYITAIKQLPCMASIHQVHEGISSWRFLRTQL